MHEEHFHCIANEVTVQEINQETSLVAHLQSMSMDTSNTDNHYNNGNHYHAEASIDAPIFVMIDDTHTIVSEKMLTPPLLPSTPVYGKIETHNNRLKKVRAMKTSRLRKHDVSPRLHFPSRPRSIRKLRNKLYQ